MGTHVVRLTDREYMIKLAAKLQEDHEARQRYRIEMRKLRPGKIVPDLTGTLRVKRRKKMDHCGIKEIDRMKKCRGLSEILFASDETSK